MGGQRARVRLRRVVTLNPSKQEVAHLPDDHPTPFVPMEAVGETGAMDTSTEMPLGALRGGYTYFREGDVVVAKITPCFENGKGAQVPPLGGGFAFGTTELHVLRPSPALDGRYLYYVTQSAQFRRDGAAAMTGSAGQQRVPTDFVGDFQIPVLSLDEQRAIAATLDRKTAAIDAVVDKKTALLDRLAEQRASVINRAVTQRRDGSQVCTVRLRRLLLGIEQGWSPECLSRQTEGNEWGVLKTGCVNGGVFDASEHKTLPSQLEPRIELEVLPGEVLMSRASGSARHVGSVAMVTANQPRLLLCDKLYRLRFTAGIDGSFAVQVLNSAFVRRQIGVMATGQSTLKNISQENVKDLVVPLPSLTEQRAIVEHIDARTAALDAAADAIRRQIKELGAYRQSIITAAVTGRLPPEAA